MLPNFKELTIPSKYQSRKNFINFVEKLIEEEICIYLKMKKEEVKTVILTPNFVVVLQKKLDKFLKEYTVYANLISESAKLNKEDPRYFKINELESFEEITDKITKVNVINKVKKFANKLLRSYSNLLYKEDGSLNENIIEKFSVIMEENLEKEKLSELFSNIKIVDGNKDGFSALLDKIIMSFNPNKQDILDLIKNENINAVVKHDENGVIIIQINDFNASEKLGNSKWCISNDKSYFEDYLIDSDIEIDGLLGNHYFVYDFNLNKDDKMSHYAFTVNFNGEITAAFDKRNEDISESVINIFDKTVISKILVPEIKRINDLDEKSCFDIIEKLEELITDPDSNDNYSLSNVFSNPLIANYILKEKTKSEKNLPEYLLNYRYNDIRKQFNNIDKLNFEDESIQELFVNSIKYAKKVYESNFNCFLNLEYVLEIISEEDPEFESETLAENPYATEEDLLETAIEYIKTNTYLNLPPHLKDYISYDFNKELLTSEDKTRALYLLSEDKKQELYETFKDYISKVLDQTSLSCFSFIQKKDKGLENNIFSILLKQYYIDYEYKLNDKEKSIICATLLKSPDIEDNKFAKEHLNDYLAENVEHFLYHYEQQSKVTKKIVIDTLNSDNFKTKIKEDKIKINYEHFTYSLFDRKEVLIALTDETKLFIKENLHPFEVNSSSGRNILFSLDKYKSYDYDLGERSVILINEGLLDMERVFNYIRDADSIITYGDKNSTKPYDSISDYIASNANKVDNSIDIENNINLKKKKEIKIKS